VYAVCLAYLSVSQARIRERGCELALGECPVDAAGVCLHVSGRAEQDRRPAKLRLLVVELVGIPPSFETLGKSTVGYCC
jgi:hypothetical protein